MQGNLSRQRIEECASELDKTIEACKLKIDENVGYLRGHYPYFDQRAAIKELQECRQVLRRCTLEKEALYQRLSELEKKEKAVESGSYII